MDSVKAACFRAKILLKTLFKDKNKWLGNRQYLCCREIDFNFKDQ